MEELTLYVIELNKQTQELKKPLHMKKHITFILSSFFFIFSLNSLIAQVEEDEDFNERREEYEFMRTRNPASGKIPDGAFNKALEQTVKLSSYNSFAPSTMVFSERGPYADIPWSGNTRPNNDICSGRVRAVMVDASDPLGKTVWIAGVTGGLWKTIDITQSPATWLPVNDYLSSLSVTDICQDPTNTNIMYFCTGDYRNTGVFRSTDHGINWSQLTSTSTLDCQRILCDYLGNIYVATWGGGVLRSTKANAGASWTKITLNTFSTHITDIKFSSSTAAGRLHVISNSGTYCYTDEPTLATATDAAKWQTFTTLFTPQNGGSVSNPRIACVGSVLYASINEKKTVADVSEIQTAQIYKSINGGASWTVTSGHPVYSDGKNVYMSSIAINPGNTNECIVGALDNWKTSNSGTTWTQISIWVGTSGQFVHADMHRTIWYDNGSKLIFASDGGIFYSSDRGTTIRDRNSGLRIRQFYSCAVHPSDLNYFLAGSQDNGVSQFKDPGMNITREVNGGDGGLVYIDQDDPQKQIGTYIHNCYKFTNDGGTNWWRVDFADPAYFGKGTGLFINPYDYDSKNNIIYACHEPGQYLRCENPFTSLTYKAISIPEIGSDRVSTVKISDDAATPNLLYLGTTGGRIIAVSNANTNSPTATDITDAAMPVEAFPSCINTGTDAENLIVSYSNYDVNSIWVRISGVWTSIEGNLPDMPVFSCMFCPGDDTRAIIATETGLFESSTFNGASTVWNRNTSIPFTRVNMIKYNKNTGVLAAATHGRGLFTAFWGNCKYSVVISSAINNTKGVEAKSTISSTSTITIGTSKYVAFDAGEAIYLQPGFHTSLSGDASFKAYIDGCGNLFPYSNIVQLPPSGYLSNQSIFDSTPIDTDKDEETPLYIRDDNFISEDISIYPNPTTGVFTISTKQLEAGAVLEIYNPLGSNVKKATLDANSNFQVDLSDQVKGIYFINIRIKDKVAQKMVVVQ